MNAGRAITAALKLQRNADLLAMLRMLPSLADGLNGWFWGWYGADVVMRGRDARYLHGYACPRSGQLGFYERCRCSLFAHRTPNLMRRARRDLDLGWEPRL